MMEKPKNSVTSATPTATVGSSLSHKMKIGQKKTARPMPLDIASVATAMETGNKYQYSSDI